MTEGRRREKCPVGHGQGSSTQRLSEHDTGSVPGAVPQVGVPGAQVPSFFSLGCAWGCGVLQAPVSSAKQPLPLWGHHSDCWNLSLGPRHRSIQSPAILLYNYYYAIIVYSVRLPTGSAGCWRRADRSWLGLALGWFASCELSGGQGDGRGVALQGGWGQVTTRGTCARRWPPTTTTVL